jgi:hypothetical protein
MLPPQIWLRKFRLRRAIRDYPLYDPPHKVEEYRLSRDQAVDNFDYFMRVRQQRAGYFQRWVRRYFRVAITLDEAGVRALNRWGNRYAGLLLVAGPTGNPSDSYFTYDPPWTGEHAGNNVLFDLGITLGEIIIAQCPRLHWDVHPIPAVLPRTTRMLERSPGMSFQRPKLAGFDDPIGEASPLHGVHGFASQMLRYMTTFDGIKRYLSLPRRIRGFIRDELFNNFNSVLRDYPAGDPNRPREQMPPKGYFAFVDDLESGDGDDKDD